MSRDVTAAANVAGYDLIIVGGGIYGAMLLLESSSKGLKSLLLEQNDFGSATSFNSLRTVHGGLRYLQSLNLPRFFESVSERSWFLRTFPELVKPLGCLMPLYGEGLRRRSIMRVALTLNDLLSANRNAGLPPESRIRSTRTIDAGQTKALFPELREAGLEAGAVWYDASVPDSQRLVMEILRRGIESGATALNYVRGEQLLTEHSNTSGVRATDMESGNSVEFRSNVVINASGPWCRQTARQFDRDDEELFHSSIAWNVLFDRDALSDHAVAIAPPKAGAQVYFAHPWKNRLLVGTGHGPWTGGPDKPEPSAAQLRDFIEEVNAAVPGIDLDETSILRVFSGLLPARAADDPQIAVKERILDHSSVGGPKGLYSISGVKLTTSRLVAAKTLQRIFPDRWRTCGPDKSLTREVGVPRQDVVQRAETALIEGNATGYTDALKELIEEESVVHLDDLVLRRTTLWEYRDLVLKSVDLILGLFDWDESRRAIELERLRTALPEHDVHAAARLS
jgi:glycerol-3-phosphate dehydrogenase